MAYNNQQNRPNNDRYTPALPVAIMLDYLKDPELFNETAQKIAIAIRSNNKMTSTQIRNFYEYVLDLLDRSEKEAFNSVLPFVKMLNSKVNYAKERKVASAEFVEMIAQCVKQVDSKEKLKVFKLFFEAVIGFSKK